MESCFVCKSNDLAEGTTAQTYQENGHLVVIKDVPCLVCKTCGETYLSTDTVKHVESFFDTVKNAEIEIVSYEAATA